MRAILKLIRDKRGDRLTVTEIMILILIIAGAIIITAVIWSQLQRLKI